MVQVCHEAFFCVACAALHEYLFSAKFASTRYFPKPRTLRGASEGFLLLLLSRRGNVVCLVYPQMRCGEL